MTPASSPLRRSARRGFTLLEIIVVVTIIALLAAVVAPRLLGQVGKAKTNAAQAKAATIAKALNLYLLDVGLSAPPADFDLAVLRERAEEGGGPNGPTWSAPRTCSTPGTASSSSRFPAR